MYNLGPQFKIDQDKLKVNEKCVFTGNRYRIEVLSERLIRIEYNEIGNFVDFASNLVICRNFKRPIFEHKEDQAFIYINTKYINKNDKTIRNKHGIILFIKYKNNKFKTFNFKYNTNINCNSLNRRNKKRD